MALHGNLVAGDIHLPYNWTYADTAARTGASGFVAGDVGKLARQTDDDSIWMLTATAPTWHRIADGGTPDAHASTHDGDGADTIASATTQKSGLMSTADKTKLDALLAEYAFGGSSGESSTQLDTFQQKYRMTTPGGTQGGRYRLRFGFTWSATAVGNFFKGRIQIDDNNVVWEMTDKPRDTYQNGFRGSAGGIIEITLQSGARTIDIEYCTGSIQETAYIKDAFLDLAYIGPSA